MAVIDTPTNHPFVKDERFFLLHRDHVSFVRGLTPRIGSSLIMLGLAAVAFFIAAACAANLLRDFRLAEEIEQIGINVEGIIVQRHTDTHKSTTYYDLTYQYTVAGRNYTQTVGTSSSVYNRLWEGMTVQVRYHPQTPEFAQMWDGVRFLRDDPRFNLLLVGVIAFPIGFCCAWIDWRNCLFSRGQLIRGEIQDARGHESARGSYRVTIYYKFKTPNGRVIRASARNTRSDMKKAPLPQQGTPIYVAYVNDRIYRLL